MLWLAAASDARAQQSPTDDVWASDARLLLDSLEHGHSNLGHTVSVASLRGAIEEWVAALPGRDRAERIVELARIVARISDGHTRIYLVPSEFNAGTGFRVLPIAFTWFPDGVYVTGATPPYRELIGGTLLRIGDMTASAALLELAPLVSRDAGNPQRVVGEVDDLLRVADVLRAVGASSRADSVGITVRLADGRLRTLTLPAETPPPALATLPEDRLPRHLRPMAEPFRLDWLPQERTLYALINGVRDGRTETFDGFALRLLDAIDSLDAARVVVDLRHNRGGDHSLVRSLVEGLAASHVNRAGALYVVIGRETFSAALWTALDLETRTDAVLVGEPTGGRPNWYGETRQILLPGTGVRASYASRFNRRTHPDDVRAALTPGVWIAGTGAAAFAGGDEVLDWILEQPLPAADVRRGLR